MIEKNKKKNITTLLKKKKRQENKKPPANTFKYEGKAKSTYERIKNLK